MAGFGDWWKPSGGPSAFRAFPWSHWSRRGMPRRFDTRFFMAAMPDGQDCRPDQRETTEGLWTDPRQALAETWTAESPQPPTLVTLQELLRYPTLERLQSEAGRRGWGAPIFPRLISLEATQGRSSSSRGSDVWRRDDPD